MRSFSSNGQLSLLESEIEPSDSLSLAKLDNSDTLEEQLHFEHLHFFN